MEAKADCRETEIKFQGKTEEETFPRKCFPSAPTLDNNFFPFSRTEDLLSCFSE